MVTQLSIINYQFALRVRENLTLVLIGLLPFHAFLVTVLTKIIAGPNHAPLTALALWKEALLAVILLLAFLEWMRDRRWKIDILDGFIVALAAVLLAVSFFNYQLSIFNSSVFFGFRYDLLPLLAFVILRRVPWSQQFVGRVLSVLLSAGCVVAGYALLTLVLPDAFFRALGYSDLHSLYVPGGSIAAFQYLGGLGIPRIQGPMSGPNQLGLWLLLPFTIAALRWAYSERFDLLRLAPLLLIGIAIDATFSRSAWIAALLILLLVIIGARHGSAVRRVGFGLFACIGIAVIALVAFKPDIVLRAASSRDHLVRPLEAVQSILAHPFGQGLGSAGPASNRTSDPCVHLEAGADASWAQAHPQLCVFVGEAQVQPVNAPCDCPFLPENWYLQFGVEGGALALALIIALTGLVLSELKKRSMTVYLWFLGVSIAALFLHAWEDPALAFTAWIMAAASLPMMKRQVEG